MADAPEKETQGDKQPPVIPLGASSRVTATVVSLAALVVVGAATANSLPNFDGFSLPNFPRFALPKFDHFSLPNFNRAPLPKSDRVAAPSPPKTTPAPKVAAAPAPDPVVSATLKDIQSSQQQSAAVLVSLTQSSASQQTDLRRISRQLSSLAEQVETLQGAVTPLTTSSIPQSRGRARVIRTSRKTEPPLPKPVGPVSVGGAPLSPAPARGSGV